VVWRGLLPRSLAAFAVALAVAAPASAATQNTRYSLAGGCYGLRAAPSDRAVPGADRLRMQATTLGSYLLYRPDRTVLAMQDDGSIAPEEKATPDADWRVRYAGGNTFTLSPASRPGRLLRSGGATRFSFRPAAGCAVYPEAELNARGKPAKGKTSYGAVGGFIEGHMHWMTFEYIGGNFHCGRPWHRYGIPYALPDCSEIEGPRGSAAPVQNFLNFGNPGAALRPAADGHVGQREPGALRAPAAAAQLVRRDVDRSQGVPGHP
jgi:hypothetical protein